MVIKPSWDGFPIEGRPCIGYAALCQGASDCGKSAVAGCLREGLGKVANVIDIWGASRGRVQACDAVLAVECASLIPEPYFIYLCPERVNPIPVNPAVYERASGLFAESGRLAQWLAEGLGIPREKIHVIPPAVAAGQHSARAPLPHLREAPRRNLLLCINDSDDQPVSRDSVRLVLDAFDLLRQWHDPQIRLTISGLGSWSAFDWPTAGVTLQDAPVAEEKMPFFDCHDLLLVPPGVGFEGLPEAFSLGVPCVAAQTSEMSDAITPGVSGAVIEEINADVLAVAIASVLGNDGIYQDCFERAPAMAAYFSWERVARQVTHVISREVGLMH